MQTLPHLETCLRASYEARDDRHPCGISLASYFVRAKTRGRRRSGVEAEVLFPPALRDRLGRDATKAIPAAMDPSSWRVDASPRATIPVATREWLAEAALGLGNAEGYALVWILLRATSELEGVAQRLLGSRLPRAVVRQVLHGVDARTLRVEPFAALLVRVLQIAQAVYAAFREGGHAHEAAWGAVQDRLWSPHPTGRRGANGAEARGAYLPSLVQAASGNARRRLRKNVEAHRTVDHARALLARFAASPAASLWPWTDGAGRVLPAGDDAVSPEIAGTAFFTLLTHTASAASLPRAAFLEPRPRPPWCRTAGNRSSARRRGSARGSLRWWSGGAWCSPNGWEGTPARRSIASSGATSAAGCATSRRCRATPCPPSPSIWRTSLLRDRRTARGRRPPTPACPIVRRRGLRRTPRASWRRSSPIPPSLSPSTASWPGCVPGWNL